MARHTTAQPHSWRFDKELIGAGVTLLAVMIGGAIWLLDVTRDLGELEGKVNTMARDSIAPIIEEKNKALRELGERKDKALGELKKGTKELSDALNGAVSAVSAAEKKAVGAITTENENALRNVSEKTKTGLAALENAEDSALAAVSAAEKKAVAAVSRQIKAMFGPASFECKWKDVDSIGSSRDFCPRNHLLLESKYIEHYSDGQFEHRFIQARCCELRFPWQIRTPEQSSSAPLPPTSR